MRQHRRIASFATKACLAAVLVWPGDARAATLCVGGGGCFASIQAAVDAAGRNDIIEIAAGTYAEAVVVPEAARLSLVGAGAGSTIIDGNGADVLTLSRRSFVNVSDLTIEDGPTGIACPGPADCPRRIVLERVVVRDNFWGVRLTKGRLEILDSVIAENDAVGVDLFGTRTTVERSTFGPSDGVGIRISTGKLTISDSTIHENGDGGIQAAARLKLVNSTVSDNGPNLGGGGIRMSSGPGVSAIVASSTIAGNQATSGGGIDVDDNVRVRIVNSILADNVAAPSGPDCEGRVIAQGFNLIEDPSGCTLVLRGAENQLGIDPLLAPLADNGGPTSTRALLPGSPAIDAGNPATPTGRGSRCPAADQRGVPRSDRCDLGSYEF